MIHRLRLLAFALRAISTARRRQRERESPEARARMSRDRLRALEKLGGACACCGLGIDFAPVLELHHVNHNGDLHRRVMKAFSVGAVTWVLETPAPRRGLFALEVLCVVCHRMLHERGACPHRKGVKRREAA